MNSKSKLHPTRLTQSLLEALHQIPGNTEGSICMSEYLPAGNYIDPAYFEREKQAIFFREPMLLGPSAYLPEPNMVFTQETLGVPLLVTRDKNGAVRAFLNACRHRGTVLCPQTGSQKAAKLVCPYHAWTYALDGQLKGVPAEAIFADLDKRQFDLVELPCRESGGLIYTGLKASAEISFADVEGPLSLELNSMGLDQMQVYRQKTYSLRANWKLLMDTMLDKYHVQRLHRNTLAKFFDDTPEVSAMIGPHVRTVSARKNFSADDIHEDFELTRRRCTFGYGLYPQGAIVVSPRYVSLCVMRPVSVDETHVDFIMLVNAQPEDAEARERLEQSWALMDIGFGQEDFWAAELGHKGLRSGAVENVLVGGMEHRIMMFHEEMYRRVAEYEAGQSSDPVESTS